MRTADMYPVIDVSSSSENYQTAYCSDLFTSLELIPLETKDNCLIAENPIILANDRLIFIASSIGTNFISQRKNIHVFNYTVKFLNQIGSIGQGPGEFYGVQDLFLNHEQQTFFVAGLFKIFEYEFTGKFIGSFPIPSLNVHRLSNFSYAEDSLFVGTFSLRQQYSYRYNVVMDVWTAGKMKELLTDEYFAKQPIKDQQAHQKLKDLLKNLKEDDNPVVVVAKLKKNH